MATFGTVEPATIVKYSSVATRVFFNVIRFVNGWDLNYQFVLTEDQITLAKRVNEGLRAKRDGKEMLYRLHQFSLSIFGHKKDDPTLDKYFSPVNRILVLTSFPEGRGIKRAGEITQTIAALVYAIRTTMFYEMENIALRDVISIPQ
jgi:hypothetical protein